jgi:hypothetical protein
MSFVNNTHVKCCKVSLAFYHKFFLFPPIFRCVHNLFQHVARGCVVWKTFYVLGNAYVHTSMGMGVVCAVQTLMML